MCYRNIDRECFLSIILNIDPFVTKPAPIESPRRDLSIGTGFVKNGSILRRLWAHPGEDIFGRNMSACISVPIFTYFLARESY